MSTAALRAGLRVLAALLTCVFGFVAGSSASAALMWALAAPALPDQVSAAADLSAALTGPVSAADLSRRDFVFGDEHTRSGAVPLLGTDGYAQGFVAAEVVRPSTWSPQEFADRVGSRGYRPLRVEDEWIEAVAVKESTRSVLTVSRSGDSLRAAVTRQNPHGIKAVTYASGAAAALAALWLRGRWVRAARARSPESALAAGVLAAVGAGMLAPVVLLTAILLAIAPFMSSTPDAWAPWGAFDLFLARPLAALGGTLMLLSLLQLLSPRTGSTSGRLGRRPAPVRLD